MTKNVKSVVSKAVKGSKVEKAAAVAPAFKLSPIGESMETIRRECAAADARALAAANVSNTLRHIAQCVNSVAYQAAAENPFKASKLVKEARKVIHNSAVISKFEKKIFGLLADCGITQDEDKNYIVSADKGAQQKAQDLIASVTVQDYKSKTEKAAADEKAAKEREAQDALDKADNANAEVAQLLVKVASQLTKNIAAMEKAGNKKGTSPRTDREVRKLDIVKGLIAQQEKLGQALAGSQPA